MEDLELVEEDPVLVEEDPVLVEDLSRRQPSLLVPPLPLL